MTGPRKQESAPGQKTTAAKKPKAPARSVMAKPGARPVEKKRSGAAKLSPYGYKPASANPAQSTQVAKVPTDPSSARPGFAPARSGMRPEPGKSHHPQQTRTDSHPPKPLVATVGNKPGAMISRRASERLRSGYLWVYASDLESVQISSSADEANPFLLPVADNRGLLLGTALYSPTSQIALRIISREAVNHAEWLNLLAERLRTSVRRRQRFLDKDTNACRLVFSEADDLPGLIVDKYAGIVIVQLLAKGLDTTDTRAVIAQTLKEELSKDAKSSLTIWERPDPRIRELEGLSTPATTALFASDAHAPVASIQFRLNGLNFQFDVNSGQKTGAFLDQSENYSAVEQWAKEFGVKRALDVCTYQGGFALHLARVCDQVTGIDASRSSLEVAERNLEANSSTGKNMIRATLDWVEGDAFEILRAWSDDRPAPAFWDLIVLDPPAFAKSKRAVEGALRGYKELNLRALMMIKPGGLLVTCSCSHHVTWTDLEGAVTAAAIDAHRRVTLLQRRGAAQDHPVVMNLPETEYLKCLICRVD